MYLILIIINIKELINFSTIKRSNMIKKIESLEKLKFLRFLNLSGNSIKSVQGIPEKHEYLEALDLEDNKVLN